MSGEQLEPGTLLNGRYRILRAIGKGGMGTVYQAEHVRLDTILAVKEVRAPQGDDADAVAMLQQCEQEARFLVKLHHPNLPQVTDAFLENDRFFVVMEYIEGVTLDARARMAGPGALQAATVIEWALQIADVLSYLHSQAPPIIFRDLKPSNVMIQADGRIRLIDFGIARRFQPGAVKDTNLLGSVGYSPPEQFGRHQTDTRTDIYAFGATMHSLLTGQDPAQSPFKFAHAGSLNPAVPERLSRLIDCCVRLDAAARPQTIHEVAMELLSIRDTVPAATMEPAPVEAEEAGSGGSGPVAARIILTNPTLRNTGRAGHGSHRIGTTHAASGSAPVTARPPSAETRFPAGEQSLPATGAAPSMRRGSVLGWAAGIGAAAALCVVAVWMVNSRARSAPQLPGAGPAARPVNPLEGVGRSPGAGVPLSGSNTSAAMPPPDTGSAPPATLSRSVTFDPIQLKGVSADGQGRPVLHISVSGGAQGQTGDQIVIAAFFYDQQNSPVASRLPQTPYSSRDGKLSVATALTLASAHESFTVPLDIPVAAFPTGIVGGVSFHCVAFFGDQRIGETGSYTSIPPDMVTAPLSGAPPAPDNGGTPAAPQNEGIPSTSSPTNGAPPSRTGTLGTRRGNSGD